MAVIKVNGENREVKLPVNLSEFLIVSKVPQSDMVSIQLNGEFVERENYDTTFLKENDEIDFLYFMGGGC